MKNSIILIVIKVMIINLWNKKLKCIEVVCTRFNMINLFIVLFKNNYVKLMNRKLICKYLYIIQALG